MKLKQVGALILIVFGTTMCVLLVYTTQSARVVFSTPDPVSIVTPPLYPNAQDITVLTASRDGQTLSYTVQADEASILSFYRDKLRRDGWTENPLGATNELMFGWLDPPKYKTYSFRVFVSRIDSTSNRVELVIVRLRSL